jgi:hypothetical protein
MVAVVLGEVEVNGDDVNVFYREERTVKGTEQR